MLYSYTGGRNLYGQWTGDTTTANLANGDTYINGEIGRILSLRSWPFLFQEKTATTTASQQYVVIPAAYRKITSVKVTTGTSIWTPKEVPNREFWDRLNAQTASSYTSDFPEWYYIFNGRCYLYPTPATSSNTVTFFGRIGFSRLNIADYTTGTITTVAASGTSVTGSGTSWHAGMVGRYIRITDGNAANSGDDQWYEISAVGSATGLTLVKPYLGTAIAAGSANYTIGQMSPIPDGYQEAPIHWAAYLYFNAKTTAGAGTRATEHKKIHDEILAQMQSDLGSGTDNIIVDDADPSAQENPNFYVRL